jgi:hypothetical protein
MLPTYEAWTDYSRSIYEKFAEQMVTGATDGMKRDPFVAERRGGYFLFRRPNPKVAAKVAEFGKAIQQIAPDVLVYPEDVLHSTFTDYQVRPNFIPSEAPDHGQVLEQFDTLVKVFPRVHASTVIYERVLFGLNAFVLEGESDQLFYLCACAMHGIGQGLGIELRMPWGAHLTFGRTSKDVSPAQVAELAKLCTSVYPLICDPQPFVSLEAGWYTMDPEQGFISHITSKVEF